MAAIRKTPESLILRAQAKGKAHGQGRYEHPDGDVYIGGWQEAMVMPIAECFVGVMSFQDCSHATEHSFTICSSRISRSTVLNDGRSRVFLLLCIPTDVINVMIHLGHVDASAQPRYYSYRKPRL